jgi:hypothetical protein
MSRTDQDGGVPKTEESIVAMGGSAEGLTSAQMNADWATSEGADSLGTEVERLRELVGPDELAYKALKLELWRLRDTVIGMEAELGNVRGRCLVLEREREDAARSRIEREPDTREGVDDFIAAAAKRASAFRERGQHK